MFLLSGINNQQSKADALLAVALCKLTVTNFEFLIILSGPSPPCKFCINSCGVAASSSKTLRAQMIPPAKQANSRQSDLFLYKTVKLNDY